MKAPGVHHCAGGPGPQDTPDRLLDKVIAWAEDGKRPNEVIGSAPTTRLLPAMNGAPPMVEPQTAFAHGSDVSLSPERRVQRGARERSLRRHQLEMPVTQD